MVSFPLGRVWTFGAAVYLLLLMACPSRTADSGYMVSVPAPPREAKNTAYFFAQPAPGLTVFKGTGAQAVPPKDGTPTEKRFVYGARAALVKKGLDFKASSPAIALVFTQNIRTREYEDGSTSQITDLLIDAFWVQSKDHVWEGRISDVSTNVRRCPGVYGYALASMFPESIEGIFSLGYKCEPLK